MADYNPIPMLEMLVRTQEMLLERREQKIVELRFDVERHMKFLESLLVAFPEHRKEMEAMIAKWR